MNVKLYLLKSIIFAKPFSFLDSFYKIKRKITAKLYSLKNIIFAKLFSSLDSFYQIMKKKI